MKYSNVTVSDSLKSIIRRNNNKKKNPYIRYEPIFLFCINYLTFSGFHN